MRIKVRLAKFSKKKSIIMESFEMTAVFFLVFFLFLTLCQSVEATVFKQIGETATVTVTCSDVDSDLLTCSVVTPCYNTCSGSTAYASCSCEFSCTEVGSYDACGRAVDQGGLEDVDCLENEIRCVLDLPPDPPGPEDGGELWDHCSIQGLSIPIFQWTYSDPGGNPQLASQVKVYGEANLDTGELSCPATCTSYHPSYEWINDNLEWGQTYNWQVRVKNNQGIWSDWSSLNSFTMPSHAYPWPDFSHTPPIPRTEETVSFIDSSECYSSSGNDKYSCQAGEEFIQYQWDFDYGEEFTVDSTNKGNTTTTYSAPGSYEVRLKIIDSTLSPSGYCISGGDSPVGSTLPLPEWKEISPISWLKNFFASLSEFLKF
jgi:hypothetical protein